MKEIYERKIQNGMEKPKIQAINFNLSLEIFFFKSFKIKIKASLDLIVGLVFKHAEKLFFKNHQRFLVLDPYSGTLIRFKKREDFPMQPKFFLII